MTELEMRRELALFMEYGTDWNCMYCGRIKDEEVTYTETCSICGNPVNDTPPLTRDWLVECLKQLKTHDDYLLFENFLFHIIACDHPYESIISTPQQQAEALLKAIGKWKE